MGHEGQGGIAGVIVVQRTKGGFGDEHDSDRGAVEFCSVPEKPFFRRKFKKEFEMIFRSGAGFAATSDPVTNRKASG